MRSIMCSDHVTLQVVGEYSYDLDGEVELEDVMEKVTVLLNWEFKGEDVCKADHTRGNFCSWRQGNIIICGCCAWKYRMLHSTSCLRIDCSSISK